MIAQRGIPSAVVKACMAIDRPAYVYDVKELRRTAGELKSSFEAYGAQLLFATMANPRAEILEYLAGMGVGACVNSQAHLNAAIRCGMPSTNIQFTSSGLSTEDIREIAAHGVQCNADSVSQIALMHEYVPALKCGARVNTRLLVGEAIGNHDRLGMPPEGVRTVASHLTSGGGQLNGLHIYVGTNFATHVEMLPSIDAFFRLAATIPTVEYVNIGGGIGVDYAKTGLEFDVRLYAAAIGERIANLSKKLGRNVRLVVEPGRALVASCGYFTCRVTDIKTLGNRTFVGVDASVAQFPRPWHHPETPHMVYSARSALENACDTDDRSIYAVVAGRTTYSKDVLSMGHLPSSLKVGDPLIFTDAGAYCDSMASRFLGQPEPASLFLN